MATEYATLVAKWHVVPETRCSLGGKTSVGHGTIIGPILWSHSGPLCHVRVVVVVVVVVVDIDFTLPFTRCRYCRHHYQDEPKPPKAIAQAA